MMVENIIKTVNKGKKEEIDLFYEKNLQVIYEILNICCYY